MAGCGIPLAFRRRAKDHWHGLVGAALLWIEAEPPCNAMVVSVTLPSRRGDVEQQCRGLTPAAGAARFTPAILRGGARAGIQLARRTARSLCGLHPLPAARELGVGENPL